MSTNKRERDCDTPRSAASGESPQPVVQEDGPRVIAGSRRVTKDLSGSSQSKRASQSQHQPNQQQHPSQVPNTSTVTSHLRQPTHDQQHIDHSVTSSVTQTYALPVYSDELGRLPLHGHLDFSAQAYLDHNNYWYQNVPNNGGTSGGGSESSHNSDHVVPPNSLSNRDQHQQVPDHHHHVPSSHNVHHYSNNPAEISPISQGFSLNPTIGTGNMMFGPMPLSYMPRTPYAGVPPSIDIGPSQNPVGGGGRPLHTSFRGISMALRGDGGGVRQESSQPPAHPEQLQHQHHQYHTQGQPQHNIHGNHHHPEQQSMGYSSYLDNDTMTMWSTAPPGFEYVFFFGCLCRGRCGGVVTDPTIIFYDF